MSENPGACMKGMVPLALAMLLTGCVERLISVRSDPPGATVLLDGEVKGVTPVDIPYTWYGGRDLTLEMAGYVSVNKRIELKAPWWQWFPFDFVTDLLIPFTLTDRTELRFLMAREPADPTNLEALKGRAEELRRKLDEKKP